MLQLLPNERLLYLQVHQRIMAASIGGKYRPASPSFARHLVTCTLFTAAQGLQQGVLHSRRQPHLQRERSADPLLFIAHYVQQVAPSCKLPLKLCGNIHLLLQRW